MTQKIKVLLLISFSILGGLHIFAQQSDTSDYKLELQRENQKIRDGIITVLVTLTNNSSDTLKYYSMSCSYEEFYSVKTEKLTIEQSVCDENSSIIIEIPSKVF